MSSRRPQAHRLIGSTVLFLTVAFFLSACRSSTEIVLKISTNLRCTDQSQWHGVAVYTGEPGAPLEKKWPTLVTPECDGQGNVGSLVIAPSSDDDDLIGVRVVAGLTRQPEDCEEAGYEGCIVARRALRYSPHRSLELKVQLTSDCVDLGCDPDHTCLTGGCVGSEVEEAAPLPPGKPSVRCGDDGVRCATTGDVCCLTVDMSAGTAHGACGPSASCDGPGTVLLLCDDDSDCTYLDDADGKAMCLLSYEYDPGTNEFWDPISVTLSACVSAHTRKVAEIKLCQDRQYCIAGPDDTCGPSSGVNGMNPLPNYYWCQLKPGAF